MSPERSFKCSACAMDAECGPGSLGSGGRVGIAASEGVVGPIWPTAKLAKHVGAS